MLIVFVVNGAKIVDQFFVYVCSARFSQALVRTICRFSLVERILWEVKVKGF